MHRFKLSTKMVSLGLICILCVTLVLAGFILDSKRWYTAKSSRT